MTEAASNFSLTREGKAVIVAFHEDQAGWPIVVEDSGVIHDRGATHEEVVEMAFGRSAVLEMRNQQQT